MNTSIFDLILIIFAQLTLYLGGTFSPYISMHGIFFGVRLDAQYKKDPLIKRITRQYLWRCSILFVISTFFTSWYMMTSDNEKISGFVFTLLIFIILGLYFICFVMAHNQIKHFAATVMSLNTTSNKTMIDTDLMAAKKQLRKHFRLLYVIPLILTLLTIFYLLYNYPHLPEQIATHWDLQGNVDGYLPKSIGNVLGLGIMQLALVGLLFYVADRTFTTRGKLHIADYEASKQALLHFLRHMGYSLFFITLSINALFIVTSMAMVRSADLGIAFTFCSLILPIAPALYMIYVWLRYRQSSVDETSYSPDNEDSHWIWGSFYYNPNDPSVFIEKRYGIGWTINLGTPMGKVLMTFTIVLVLVCLLLPLFVS